MSEELWREMRRLDAAQGQTALSVAGHLGECSARHAEIQRRFEAADTARGELRSQLAGDAASIRETMARENTSLRAEIAKTNARLVGLLITVSLASIGIVGQIVLKATKIIP